VREFSFGRETDFQIPSAFGADPRDIQERNLPKFPEKNNGKSLPIGFFEICVKSLIGGVG
jgi:hypothetical protein